MKPEVQAAIIKAASDWAILIVKDLNPPTKINPKLDLESLQNIFRLAYEKIGNVVEP